MCNHEIQNKISNLICDMMPELEKMVDNAPTSEMATENIMNFVSSKVTGASRGYLSSLYTSLSEKTLKDEMFQIPANANKFFELNLEKKIIDAYRLDVKNFNSYKAGVSVKEINGMYTAAGAAVGSMAVGGILLGVLTGMVDIPIVVVIGGAVGCGIAGGLVTYKKVVPKITKSRYKEALKLFMKDFESELYSWIDAVAEYYNKEVEALKKTL